MVLLTETSLAEAIRIDELCRAKGIAFIKSDIRGVFANVFCDFGPSFTVFDVDGETFHHHQLILAYMGHVHFAKLTRTLYN